MEFKTRILTKYIQLSRIHKQFFSWRPEGKQNITQKVLGGELKVLEPQFYKEVEIIGNEWIFQDLF